MSDNRFDFIIDNNRYVIHTDKDREQTEEIINYVNERILESRNLIKYKNKTMFATLAAINIADDLFTIKKELEGIKEDTKDALENYMPLKEKYARVYEEYSANLDNLRHIKIIEHNLNNQLNQLKEENAKLRAKVLIDDTEKEKLKKENKELLDTLFNQEKELRELKKQLQEITNRR